MRRGRDRQPLAGRVETDGLTRVPDRREARREVVDHRWRRARRGRSPRRACGSGSRGRRRRGARGRRADARPHEGVAVPVAQERAFAPQRLGEQRTRHRRMMQRGRMELHELHIGTRDPGPQRQRDSVAGRERRVRRDRVALTGATGRDDGVGRPHLDRAPGRVERDDARGLPVDDEQREREPSLADLAARRDRGRDERPLDLGAGRVATRVHDARERVATLAGEQPTTVVIVEPGADLGQLANAVGALRARARRPRPRRTGRRPRRPCRGSAARANRVRPAPRRRLPARTTSPSATARPS